MERFNFSKKGFTLVEMLIAMAIFVAFTGVLIGSYTSIVRAQREANEYRIMYSEARKIFETLIFELRDSMIDCGNHGNVGVPDGGEGSDVRKIFFVSKDGNKQTEIIYDKYDESDSRSGKVSVRSFYLQDVIKEEGNLKSNYTLGEKTVALNDPDLVKITNFRIYVTPGKDPYDPYNVDDNSVQFQPKITIYAHFKREFLSGSAYEMDLQTSVSSRVYNQIIPNTDSKKEQL